MLPRLPDRIMRAYQELEFKGEGRNLRKYGHLDRQGQFMLYGDSELSAEFFAKFKNGLPPRSQTNMSEEAYRRKELQEALMLYANALEKEVGKTRRIRDI